MNPDGIALVTGASRGLGRATALELAARGFEVVATMRDPAAGTDLPGEAARRGGRLRTARLDVTRPDANVFPDGLRVLVNNAGVEGQNLPVEHTPLASWRETFETNVFGQAEVTRLAIPKLREAGGGVVCNVGSASLLVPMPFFAVYRASKAAASALGESLRAELAPFGIRLLEILPGPVDTDMLAASQVLPEAAAFAPYRAQARRVADQRRAAAGNATPTSRAAMAIADAILDDTRPLRVACEPLGEALLEGWRARSDEEAMLPVIRAFAPPSDDA